MRLVSALALAATLASSALAQTQYADSSGGYVALNGIAFNSDIVLGLDATAGYRFSTGADVGFRLGREKYGTSEAFITGPTAGFARPIGSGWTGRVEGSVQYTTSNGSFVTYPEEAPEGVPSSYRFRDVREDITVTVSRPLRLAGSFRLRPTIGLFAAGRQGLTASYTGAGFAGRSDSYATGVHLEIPLTFRVFGQDAAWVTTGRFALTGRDNRGGLSDRSYAGGGLRLNF
ncbi:MAG TPA: hypothetical protein VF594_10410 [Rubricoccaceae bacterium]|jgi:hypothetical protein